MEKRNKNVGKKGKQKKVKGKEQKHKCLAE